MASKRFQDLQVYRLAENLADEIWQIVNNWDNLAKDTLGKQLVCAADNIGAKIAKGVGEGDKYGNRDRVRESISCLQETQHSLRLAYRRNILTPEQVNSLKIIMEELSPKLDAYLRSIGNMPDEK